MADPTLLWGTRTISVTQAWYTPDLSSPPSIPPFRGPDNDNDNDNDGGRGPFQANDPDKERDRDGDDDNDDNAHHLSPGVIAAIVVGAIAFVLLVVGLLAYLNYRRRRQRARKQAQHVEIALKEEEDAVSARAVDATAASSSSSSSSGAAALADPPPPYEGVQLESQHHHYAELEHQDRRWERLSSPTGSAMDDDPDVMGSHATIMDGLEPGRHKNHGGGS
jgi:cbb3-type cytochrome oxidase subunit 3